MTFEEMIKLYTGGAWILQTWTLGKPFLGAVDKVTTAGDNIIFQRLDTKEGVRQLEGTQSVVVWKFRGETNLTISKQTEFHLDGLGRIHFSMGTLGLATLFPPTIDPKLPINK